MLADLVPVGGDVMRVKVCECCGQPLPTDVTSIAERLKLSPQHRSIFEALASANGRIFTHDQIFDLMWGTDIDGGPDNPISVARVQIHYLNRKLTAEGFRIEGVWGQGYRLLKQNAAPAPSGALS
jgi:DNA-binding response OmpR family regulator